MSVLYRDGLGASRERGHILSPMHLGCYYCGAVPGAACSGSRGLTHKARKDALERVQSGPYPSDVVIFDGEDHKYRVLAVSKTLGAVELRAGRSLRFDRMVKLEAFVDFDAVADGWRIARVWR